MLETTKPIVPLTPNQRKLIRKWVVALRIGNFKQTDSLLMRQDTKRHKPGYCCLGVLCEVVGTDTEKKEHLSPITFSPFGGGLDHPAGPLHWPKESKRGSLSTDLQMRVGITGSEQTELMELNDERGYSFKKIATWIEDNILKTANRGKWLDESDY